MQEHKDNWGDYVDIPLKQHIGKPSIPIVQLGTKVLKGQRIANIDGLGANIHSSVYGVVSSIGDTIRIMLDKDQPDTFVKIQDTKTHLEAIEEAGVVGAGGAGFPAHIKLNINLDGGSFIVNAAECEPGLIHNVSMLEQNAELIVRSLYICMEITNAARGYIAIKSKNKKAISALALASSSYKNIELKYLPDSYPSGDERFIIRDVLGKELAPGELPSVYGVVVSNAETMKRIIEAIELRKPVITKDLTLNGRIVGLNSARAFLEAPIGTPIGKFIEECGGYLEPYGEIVLGGAFTGVRGSSEATLTKTLGGVFVSMPFPNDVRRFGVLGCECGAQAPRLSQIVEGMGGSVVAEGHCKRMESDPSGRLRCTRPGQCPGQAEKIIELKKKGAEAIIVGTCED